MWQEWKLSMDQKDMDSLSRRLRLAPAATEFPTCQDQRLTLSLWYGLSLGKTCQPAGGRSITSDPFYLKESSDSYLPKLILWRWICPPCPQYLCRHHHLRTHIAPNLTLYMWPFLRVKDLFYNKGSATTGSWLYSSLVLKCILSLRSS